MEAKTVVRFVIAISDSCSSLSFRFSFYVHFSAGRFWRSVNAPTFWPLVSDRNRISGLLLRSKAAAWYLPPRCLHCRLDILCSDSDGIILIYFVHLTCNKSLCCFSLSVLLLILMNCEFWTRPGPRRMSVSRQCSDFGYEAKSFRASATSISSRIFPHHRIVVVYVDFPKTVPISLIICKYPQQ
jgi:hypothetical protein